MIEKSCISTLVGFYCSFWVSLYVIPSRGQFFVEATTGQRTPGDWCKSGEGAKCLGLVTGPKTHEQKMIQKMHDRVVRLHILLCTVCRKIWKTKYNYYIIYTGYVQVYLIYQGYTPYQD